MHYLFQLLNQKTWSFFFLIFIQTTSGDVKSDVSLYSAHMKLLISQTSQIPFITLCFCTFITCKEESFFFLSGRSLSFFEICLRCPRAQQAILSSVLQQQFYHDLETYCTLEYSLKLAPELSISCSQSDLFENLSWFLLFVPKTPLRLSRIFKANPRSFLWSSRPYLL